MFVKFTFLWLEMGGLNKGHTRNKNMVYAIVIKANFLADTAYCTDFTK